MMFSMLEVMPVLLGWRFRCFDATRLSQSNKLEFAQFGAHMQKLWQYWFPSGSTAARAAVPLITPSGSTAVQSGSTAYGHKR